MGNSLLSETENPQICPITQPIKCNVVVTKYQLTHAQPKNTVYKTHTSKFTQIQLTTVPAYSPKSRVTLVANIYVKFRTFVFMKLSKTVLQKVYVFKYLYILIAVVEMFINLI